MFQVCFYRYLVFFSIIGKSSLAKVPLFGYMFSRLYIAVNRSVGKKRYEAFEKGLQAVDEGRNLVIFPEGGITSKEPPKMGEFKEGAFKIAIQKNIPIIPVTIYNNWIIMEDKKDKILRWKLSKVKFHSSIETKSLSLDNVQELKDKVFEIISKELELEFSDRV